MRKLGAALVVAGAIIGISGCGSTAFVAFDCTVETTNGSREYILTDYYTEDRDGALDIANINTNFYRSYPAGAWTGITCR